MAGTAKDYNVSEIHQGPGDVWVIGTAPTDGNVRLTLAGDGTPDTTAHPGSVHLGAMASAVSFTAKPKVEPITLEQYDSPIDGYVSELEVRIEAEMAQSESSKLHRTLGVGTYAAGAGYKQITFGGGLTVPSACIALISPRKANPLRHLVAVLYRAVATGGFQMTMGRAKPSTSKATFVGLVDTARTAGKQMGVVYETLADAAGGTPTARDVTAAEIFQGPCDLWALATAPADGTARVTLDAATLTPDAAVHGASKHLGVSEGGVTFGVTPKLELLRADQFDGPFDAWVSTLDTKLECEMSQSSVEKLSRALGLSGYTSVGGAYNQVVFGSGVSQPDTLCIAAIGRKRTDATKAVVVCLYRVQSTEGIQVQASRLKKSSYKVSFMGQVDATRTAGKQIGVYHEMV